LAGDAVIPGNRAALSPVPDELDQMPRLAQFRTAHPEAVILLRGALPKAWVGGRKIEHPALRGLLDELEAYSGSLQPPHTAELAVCVCDHRRRSPAR
jgi:hypothetical protein